MRRLLRPAAGAWIAVLLLSLLCPMPAHADGTTITVDTAEDNHGERCVAGHPCSLRAALSYASTSAGDVTIEFDIPGPAPVTLTPLLDNTVTPGTPVPGPEAMAREDANCRLGPSTQFNVATHLTQGQVVPITGRLTQGGWSQVQPPDLQVPCWIAEGIVDTYGDLNALPDVTPPAPPTPTPTDEPVSPAQGCMWWNGNVYICRAPCPANYQGAPCTP